MKKTWLAVILVLIPVLATAWVMIPVEDPSQNIGVPDNTIIDIVSHQGAVWMATGRGVTYSYFDDSIWNTYDRNNGLIGDNLSAIYSGNGLLWVAMNHVVEISEDNFAIVADGLALFTGNEEFPWDNVITDDSILSASTKGENFTIYDITGKDSIVFCAAFAGGLLASFNDGWNWKKVYFSYSDSVADVNGEDPPFSDRYFSAVVDTTHNDSMILWAGTAAGLMRYVWGPDYAKPASNYITDLVAVDEYIFICGDSGLSRLKFDSVGERYISAYNSAFMRDGLPGMATTTAYGFGNRLFVGTMDSIVLNLDSTFAGDSLVGVDSTRFFYSEGVGLAVSDDDGQSFVNTGFTGLDDLLGQNRYPAEFADIGGRLFMAAREAGLFYSDDTGLTWTRLPVDTLDASFVNPRNIVNTLTVDSTNLWVGTDTGLVIIRCDAGGNDTLHEYIPFEDNANSGARCFRVRVQNYVDSATGDVDSLRVWSLRHPVDTAVGEYAVYFSRDYGQTWLETRPYVTPTEFPYYDIDFIDSIVYLVGEEIFSSSIQPEPAINLWLKFDASTIRDSNNIAVNFTGLDLQALLIVDDTIYIGSERGLAISPPGGLSLRYRIDRANHNPLAYDKVTNIGFDQLTGEFVNALGVQPLPQGQSRIWASTKPTIPAEYLGVSVGSTDGLNWRQIPDMEAWNFAFNGPEVFAATTEGLMYSADTGWNWTEIPIQGVQLSSDPPVNAEIDPRARVIAVEVIGDSLWVGTEGGGAARIALNDIQDGSYDTWSIYRVFDSSFVMYAYPIPFSHANNSSIYFHYHVPEPTNVTLEVYDFAMDLVRVVVDGEFRNEGIYNTDHWDGLNGRNDRVAVGMYYYKLEFSSGETHWGKLAIVP